MASIYYTMKVHNNVYNLPHKVRLKVVRAAGSKLSIKVFRSTYFLVTVARKSKDTVVESNLQT